MEASSQSTFKTGSNGYGRTSVRCACDIMASVSMGLLQVGHITMLRCSDILTAFEAQQISAENGVALGVIVCPIHGAMAVSCQVPLHQNQPSILLDM